MKKEKLGQEPAFATSCENLQSQETWQSGMSKRFYAACAAMQGLISTGKYTENGAYNPVIGKISFKLADELLRQEGGEE